MFPLALLNAASPPSPPDPSLTLVLLHFDGADGSTVFTDSSSYARTFVRSNTSTAISTANSKFGGSSLLSTNGVQGLEHGGTLGVLGADNWTVEGWFSQTAATTGTAQRGLFRLPNTTLNHPIHVFIEAQKLHAEIAFAGESFTDFSHQTTTSVGTFMHWALVRNGDAITLYLNGVASVSTINAMGKAMLTHTDVFISRGLDTVAASTTALNGYQDEFRFRKEAVYTADFTPPTSAFTY